jgi:hypothetical protein
MSSSMTQKRKTPQKRSNDRGQCQPAAESGSGTFFAIAAAMLLIGFAFMPSRTATLGYSCVLLAGVLISAATGLWMLVIPFRESFVCGLLYVFVPIYWFYYLISRWHKTRRTTLWHLGGIVLTTLAIVAVAIETQAASRQSMTGATVRHVAMEIKHPARLLSTTLAAWTTPKDSDGV